MEVMIGMKIGKVVCDKDKEKHEGGKEEEGEDDRKCVDEETEDEENDLRRSWGGNRGRNNEVAILQLTTHCNRQRTPQSPQCSHRPPILDRAIRSSHAVQSKSCTMCSAHCAQSPAHQQQRQQCVG